MSNLEIDTELRNMKLRIAGKPELVALPIADLQQLAKDTLQMAEDCGVFDPAYEHLLQLGDTYRRIAFLKRCNELQLDRHREAIYVAYYRELGFEIIGMNSEEALEAALIAPDPKTADFYLALAALLEANEKR